MEQLVNSRILCAVLGIGLVAACGGCGWSSPESKHNTMTGVSESGYPAGHPADPVSPALASQKRPEKKGGEAKPAEMK